MDAGPEGIGTGPAAESAGQGRGMASPACSCGCRCASAGPGEPGLVEVVQGWTRALAGAEVSEIDDAGLLALVEGLEVLGRVAGAASARVQVAFGASQVAAQARDGVPASRRGRAVADDLAAARRTSPYWAGRELTAARALVGEMPATFAALAVGTISPAQARLVTEATSCLDPADRAQVDRRLAGSLEGASTRQIVAAARALAYELDPAGFVGRARRAAADRGVSVRPAPDVMGLLCARLPAAQAIATHQVLRTHAEGARAAGDPRTLNQLMADELVARVTGRTVVDGIDVEVGLVLTDATLLAGDSAAADLTGYGPLPADLARDLLTPSTDTQDTHDTDTREAPDDHDDTDHPQVDDDEWERSTGGGQQNTGAGQHGTGDKDRPARGRQQAPGPCPAGGRCTDARCTAVHGGTPPGPPPPTLPTRTSQQQPQTPGGPTAGTPRSPGSTGSAGSTGSTGPPASTGSPGSPGLPGPDPGTIRAGTVWLRRLWTDPLTGVLTVRDPRRRVFTGALRATLIARGRYCAHAWCGAPIRHLDHITRYRDGGTTTVDNARGLCARCNLAREHPRHADPPPSTYQDPPPVLDTFHGRPPAKAPSPRTGSALDDEDDPLRRSA
ncbi:DUF222 domain-containing protein [Ornithinimicrobium sp. W1665]|uniref:HNH endonuclease n=1 Tax=Ornithinimicrobium sp. W1665 TaxID=3416666 RepID=UPI003CE99601